MIYVIIGYKHQVANHVHYATAITNVDCLKEVARSFEKGAEFIVCMVMK